MQRRFVTLGMGRHVRSVLRSFKTYGNAILIRVTRGRRKSLLLFNRNRRTNHAFLSLACHANKKQSVRTTRHLSKISSRRVQLFFFSRTTSLIRVVLHYRGSIVLQRFRPNDTRLSLPRQFLTDSVRGTILIKGNATRLRGRDEFTRAQLATRGRGTTRRGTTTGCAIRLQGTNRGATFFFNRTSLEGTFYNRNNRPFQTNNYHLFNYNDAYFKNFHCGILIRHIPTTTT